MGSLEIGTRKDLLVTRGKGIKLQEEFVWINL